MSLSYWQKKTNEFWDQWMAETEQESGNPDDFLDWAIENGKLAARPQDVKKFLKKEVTQALRQARRYDEEGKYTYRAKQSVMLFDGGTPVRHYFDTDKGGTATLRQKSVKQRREAVAHDVYRGVCDAERMSNVFSDEPQLSFLKDFTDDVAELRAAEWLDHDKGDDED